MKKSLLRKVSEKDLQHQILDYLKAKKIFHYRNNSGAFKNSEGHFYRFGALGSPDIVAVIKGQYIGIEVKGTTGKLSPHQSDFRGQLEEAGGRYIVVHSFDEFLETRI